MLFVVVSVASFIGVARAAGVTGKTVVDPDTTNSWTQYTRPDDQPSTQNVGRIWTDKSVFKDTYTFSNDNNEGLSGETITKGDSDFIVSLSALSSTSNLKSTTVSTKPLDIVLVLDVSGSMDDPLVSYAYNEVYSRDLRQNRTYYIQVNGEWTAVSYHEAGFMDRNEGWRYWSGWGYTYVEPKTSAGDDNSQHFQFYTRTQQQSVDKIQALKNAANQFIDSVGDLNQNITDENDLSRIAIVKYADDTYHYTIGNNRNAPGGSSYNYTQVVSDFSSDAAELKEDINSLRAGGATSADYGLTMAQNVLNGGHYEAEGWSDNKGEGTYVGARDDAQKVVIFFTDGEPNHSSDWSGSVAAASVNIAHDMKATGTTIYTIGVVNGANPDQNPADASNLNKYLHAVSSNYKDATAQDWRGDASWSNLSLGDRTQDKDGGNANYYYAAEDSEQLDQVFEDITSSITENAGSGSPIVDESPEGNLDPGDLTFTDQLGSYMQVTGTGAGTDKIQLAYGDEIYTSDRKETNGNVDTYHFTGTVDGNAVYGSANLADLTVTVTRSDDLATGDTITVTLPASLIPLRNYNVDTDTHDMTVSQAYPVRLFYGVSLKAGAKEALNKPSSDEYAAIVASQKSADGKTIDFYSNNFTAGAADGLTTATFEPNAGNKFYYYTQNTTLYVDEGCNTEATQWNIGNYNTLYWKDTYWVQTSEGTGEERSTGVAIQRGTAEWNAMQKEDGWDGAYYIPAGTQRTDRPATLTDGKDSNETKTAANVLNPSWSDTDEVTQALGNNGKLYYEMPGSLEIKKTVDWGNASDETKQNTEKNTFTFEITASVPSDEEGKTEPLSGTYNYYVGDKADGNVTFNEGKATLEVKGGTTVRIDSLPVGTEFTVTEKGVGDNGWTVKDATAQDGVQNDNTTDGIVTGTIESATQVSLTFDNVYRAADVNLSTNTTLSVEKVLKGRDWRDSDEFTFDIDGLGNTAGNGITTPEPADTTITVNSQTEDYKASFGDITFTAPGEYRYNITEDNDTDPINGIDYSAAIYRVVVTVTDDGNGKLVVSKVELQQTQNDEGTMGAGADPVPVEGSTATFTNTYDVNSAPTNIDGTKVYNDTTGGNGIDYGKFTFQLEALGGYETKGGSSVNYTVDATDVPMPADVAEGTTTKQVTNTGHDFTFGTINYDGNDVGKTFEYKVTEIAGDEKGMSYDETEHIVQVEVEEVTTGEGTPEEETHLVATVLPPYDTPAGLKFTNEYDPADAVLEGDTAIHGTKTLVGREMHDGEAFYFKLTAMSDNAKSVLPESQVVQVTKADMQDGSAGFVFGNMTFAKTGEYTFTVDEVASDGQGGYTETADGAGMTYDTNTYTVKVNVADNHDGTLKAEVTYTSDTDGTEAEEAQFTNTYEASMNYGAQGKGGIKVTKQLTNRPMNASEFEFSITGVDSDTVKAEDANKKLAGADTSFSNTAVATGQVNTMDKLQSVTFDETDAGKTYSYIVDETTESGAPQVTYDKTQYRVDIKVVDNGNGTMHTLTTVTKIQNAQGEPANTVIVDKANSDADGYTAPTFGFVNEYNPTPATVGEGADYQIQVTKYVEGADSATDYTFTLKLADSSAGMAGYVKGLGQDGTMTVATSGTIPAGESQTLTFGELTFSKPGTYSFTVQENAPDADAGWEFDTGERTVTVEVTDRNAEGKYDGKLYIAKVDGSPVEITNRYAADPVVVGGEDAEQQITVQKTVKGAASTTDFQFKIEPVDKDDEKWDNVKAVESDFDGQTSITEDFAVGDIKTATFGGIKFSATGEYQFKITEVMPEEVPAGWTYDEHESFVTVTVTDDGEGQLVAAVSYDNAKATAADQGVNTAAAFTNVYKASGSLDGDADGNLTVTKNYTSNLGDPWTPDDSFGFTLAADTTDEPTKQAVDNGWITLPENAGTADKAGITVTDESENHQTSFGDITFTHAGTFKFTVREVLPEGVNTDNPTKDGITYDTSVKTVTVNVNDNGDGTLTATVADGSDALTFDNTYNVQPVMFRAAYFALQGNKVLDGRNWEQGDTFTFTMTAGRGTNPDGETQMDPGVVEATMPEKTSDTIEPLADGSKVTDNSAQFTFTDERYPGGDVVPDAEDVFTFTQPGTYRYLIAETNPNASNPGSGILGVTYDQTQYRLTVVVEDDGNGNLQVTSSKFSSRPTAGSGEWTDIAGDQGITFTNKYSASEVGVSFNAAKVLTGRDTAMSDNEFMFHMTFAGWMSNDDFDAQSENWKMDGEVAEKAPAAAADKGNIIRGDVIFDNVTFTSDNVGYTYRYAITEVIPDDATNAAYPGVAYGTASAEQKAAAGWTKNGVTYDGSTKYVIAKVTSEQTQDQQNPGTYIEVVRVATGGEAPYNTQTGAFEGDAIFTNTYDAGSTDVDTGTAEAKLTKVLTGKAWDGDSFTFKIEAVSNTAGIEVAQQPMPAQTEVKVNAATGEDAEGNDQATFSFGKISYDTPGTYVYKVTEVAGNNPGITYSKNEATITVSVKDNNAGGYTTGVTVANNVFTNEYASELDFAAAGGIEITKAFENASMRAFSFTVKPADQKSADKLGIDMDGETFTTKAGATVGDDNASHAEIMVIDAATEAKFTQNDADDTYTYTVQEVQGADASVDYDGTVYTVSITTTDDGHGGIKVTTTVTDGAGYTQTYVYDNDENEDPTAVIPFTNTYKATGELGGNGSASIKATKTLTNRPMVDGEFTFNVTNAADPNDAVVATGTNAADGTITFSAIDYSIDQMMEDVDNNLATPSVVDGKNTFTYTYDVTENTANLDDGVAAIDAAGFQITVTVTDNGEGTLGVAVGYPQGSENGLTFRNTYGEGQTGQQTIAIAGAKQLKVESGNNAPDIEGKYTFTLTGEDGAPMPATTEATNDASGNVSFGDITFTMENVFGDTGSQTAAATAEAEGTEDAPAVESAQRTKTFTYTVTETGDVAGVANDAEASKTFTVTVTDNGDGTLSAVADPAQGALFTFTNTYSVDPQTSSPTADGGLTLTKELTGRTMDEGEFQVVMVDADGTQVSQGVNAADGSIALDAITFSTPGDYTYTFYEVDSHKGGVTYDAARYTATAHVEDKGNGTLSVTWEFADANGDPVTDVVVSNSYEARDASIYVGGSKVLDGRALAEDEFSFELRDADGNVLQTVKNAADGGFVFDAMTFDTAGEYQFTVAEALPEDDDPATAGVQKDGVTYDETVYTVDVTVEDNREGYLWVTSLTYNGKAELPVFSNTYVEPAAPAGPSDDGLIQTSDMMPTAVMAAAGIGAVCVAAGVVTRKKRGE